MSTTARRRHRRARRLIVAALLVLAALLYGLAVGRRLGTPDRLPAGDPFSQIPQPAGVDLSPSAHRPEPDATGGPGHPSTGARRTR